MFRKNIIKLSTTEYDLYLCKSCYCDRLSVSNKMVQKRFLLYFAKIWVSRRIQKWIWNFLPFQLLDGQRNKIPRLFKGGPESGLQTKTILYLKSMSERGGSDIQRLCN